MKKLQLKFVDCMPRPLEDEVIYVSIRFGIVSHNCCCGCGNEVVLNLSWKGWQLTYDGESISLYPSIGNWNFKCRSHYWIIQNEVRWAESWSDEKIKKILEREGRVDIQEPSSDSKVNRKSGKKSIWARITRQC